MNIIIDIGQLRDVQVINIILIIVWSNGRFKTSKVVNNPDKMRKIYFAPRLVLYILRGPLLMVKLILKAASKSVAKPFIGLNKRMCRSSKPKFWYFLNVQY